MTIHIPQAKTIVLKAFVDATVRTCYAHLFLFNFPVELEWSPNSLTPTPHDENATSPSSSIDMELVAYAGNRQ